MAQALALSLAIPQMPLTDTPARRRLLRGEMRGAMETLVTRAANIARAQTPSLSGTLRGSIATQVTQGTAASALTRGTVYTGKGAHWALWVELGTRAQFSSFPSRARRASRTTRMPPRAPMEVLAERYFGNRRLWFVLARAIARRGTRAHHPFLTALEAVRPQVEPVVRAAAARIAVGLLGGV